MYAPTNTIVGLSDMGELAVRLNSIVTHDRRGNVIWLDDFESGIDAWKVKGTAGYSATWDAAHHKNGGFACKLVTAAINGANTQITAVLALPTLSKLGVEVAITHADNIKEIQMDADIFTATATYYIKVKWVAASQTWYYWNSVGGWTAITPTQALHPDNYLFNHIKLVSDPAEQKYGRLLVNDKVYDLSDVAPQAVGALATIGIMPAVIISTNTDAAATAWVDNVIVTQNEP